VVIITEKLSQVNRIKGVDKSTVGDKIERLSSRFARLSILSPRSENDVLKNPGCMGYKKTYHSMASDRFKFL